MTKKSYESKASFFVNFFMSQIHFHIDAKVCYNRQ
nr:MAG TPA: hypothetical protein [Caudoviricetes sp.]